MRRILIVVCLFFGVLSYAQGRGHGGAGAPAGGGPPSGIGAGGGGMGHSDIGRANNPQSTSGDRHSSPDTLLAQNKKLSSNLQKLLPSGTTPKQACSGFKSLGQCVAAIHVSHNLGIPFADLKAKTTGDHAESLGKAIHDLKPDADAKVEKKKAEKQANEDMNEASS